ncbi:Os01g0831400 [Oryza sativa Japonica Group]|uniref:Os01g0831400 protein n=1 Tax=Oryza sativa subsp. japonica TaxID=39947 RepID=A0A0P0VA74_ORYSJ|nr:Os01g0831400 [Oryza sativa Japonica Group]
MAIGALPSLPSPPAPVQMRSSRKDSGNDVRIPPARVRVGPVAQLLAATASSLPPRSQPQSTEPAATAPPSAGARGRRRRPRQPPPRRPPPEPAAAAVDRVSRHRAALRSAGAHARACRHRVALRQSPRPPPVRRGWQGGS